MTYEFKLPDLGEGVHEGQVIKLLVAEGDMVKEDQPLMEVETDKAAVEIPSPYTGVVKKLHAAEQQIVYVGDVMVTFGDPPTLEVGGKGEGESSAIESTPAPATQQAAVASNGEPTTSTITTPARRKPASPAVRKLARQRGIDLELIHGSGPGGRITRADLENATTAPPPAQATTPVPPEVPPAPPSAAPVVRREPQLTPVTPQPSVLAREITGTEGADDWGPIVTQPISMARKAIARIMSHSVSTIPHVTDSDDADVTDLDAFRRGYAHPLDSSRKISMLAFVVRATVKALQLHPIFNASFDAESGEIIYKRYYHIAIGVQTERGLIAPVIRDADRLNIGQLSDAIMTITENARARRTPPGRDRRSTP